MCLERFLSASFAGSSISLNFRNWRQRTWGSKTFIYLCNIGIRGTVTTVKTCINCLSHFHILLVPPGRRGETHVYLLVAGGEPPLLEHHHVMSDPLQQQSDQLIILLPAQLQLLDTPADTGQHKDQILVQFIKCLRRLSFEVIALLLLKEILQVQKELDSRWPSPRPARLEPWAWRRRATTRMWW